MTCDLNIFNLAKQVGDEGEIHEVNCIDSLVQDCMQTSLHTNPLESCIVSPTALEYNLSEEVESLYSLLELSEVGEMNKWTPKFQELPHNDNKKFPSIVHPPTLELKPLLPILKYVFLREKETFSVVILSSLNNNQEAKILAILKTHRNSIGWTIADIKGISPSIYTHHIYLGDDIKSF